MKSTLQHDLTLPRTAYPKPVLERTLFAGLMAVLLFSVLTVWTLDRWPIAIMQTGICALAIFAVWRSGFTHAAGPKSWLSLPFIVVPLLGISQLLSNGSAYRFATWSSVLDWSVILFAFLAAHNILCNSVWRNAFLTFSTWFGALLSTWAILQLFSAEGKFLWIYRLQEATALMGPFLNRDHYSALIELLLPIAIWKAVVSQRQSTLYGAMAALMYASVIAGASRAGAVLVNLEVPLVVLATLKGHREHPVRSGAGRRALVVVLLVSVFLGVVGWDFLTERFQLKDPLADRREIWQSGLHMFEDRPWLGFGLGTWTTVFPKYSVYDAQGFVNAAHCDWLQWAGEGGIVLAAIMLVVAMRALQLGIRVPWGLGVACVFLHALVDFPFQKQPLFLWTVVMLAALDAENLAPDIPPLQANVSRFSNRDGRIISAQERTIV